MMVLVSHRWFFLLGESKEQDASEIEDVKYPGSVEFQPRAMYCRWFVRDLAPVSTNELQAHQAMHT